MSTDLHYGHKGNPLYFFLHSQFDSVPRVGDLACGEGRSFIECGV